MKCNNCGREIASCFSDWKIRPRLCVAGKLRIFCDDICMTKWKNQLFVEEYKGEQIYKLGDEVYVPYIEAHYYFKTIEDCKRRIDDKTSAYGLDLSMLSLASKGEL